MPNYDFWDAYDRLDEVYLKDFDEGPNDRFYHFYSNIEDALNSLKTKTVYANKNAAARLGVQPRQ